MHAILLAALCAATDAPVTAATVYSDRARVTRTASVSLSGTQKIEFPLLGAPVDSSSIRVEAKGAEVERVDIAWVETEAFAATDGRKLLAQIEKLDDDTMRAQQERAALQATADALARLSPAVPPSEPLKPPAKLNPAGWSAAADLARARLEAEQQKIREHDEKLRDLALARQKLAEQARLLGGVGRKPGWRVVATVTGHGQAAVSLVYVVTQARWTPSYDIQLDPSASKVQVSFAGLVSQETGEDWNDAALTLSTAVPAAAMQAPKLLAWKIGEKERFIPTPQRVYEPAPPPPPPVPPRPPPRAGDEALRERLLALADSPPPDAGGSDALSTLQEQAGALGVEGGVSGGEVGGVLGGVSGNAYGAAPAGRPEPPGRAYPEKKAFKAKSYPAAPPPMQAPAPSRAEAYDFQDEALSGRVTSATAATAVMGVGLAPPSGWIAPSFGPGTPVALAGGYDLSWPSLRPETVKSGHGVRRVALFSQSWPVTVERRLFPAMAPDAYLVADLKSPSPDVLPGGPAHLFVGADPAGDAQLKILAPGEEVALPLGLDRALQPKRNVNLVEEEKGLIFGKEELTTYEVEIELANPYRKALAAKIYDQIPVTDDKHVEVKLVKVEPAAALDPVKGQLEWKLDLPPSGKTVLKFSYSIRRPKGWRMHQ